MTILDKEFSWRWLKPTGLCLLVFLLLFILGDLFGLSEDLINNPPSMSLFFSYLAYRTGYGLFFMAPLVGLIGSFWSINEWKRNNEWSASLSSGASPIRILRGPIGLISLFTLVLILYSVAWLPSVSKRAKFIRERHFKGNEASAKQFNNLHLQYGAHSVVKIKQLDPGNGSITGVTVIERHNGQIQKRIDSSGGSYNADKQWNLDDVTIRQFNPDGSFNVQQKTSHEIKLAKPAKLRQVFGHDPRQYDIGPEELSVGLLRLMKNFRLRHNMSYSVETIYLHWKFAYPLSMAILSFCGLLIASKFDFTRASGIGVCILLGFGYWVLFNTSLALGKSSTFTGHMVDYFFDLTCVYGPQLLTLAGIISVGRFRR